MPFFEPEVHRFTEAVTLRLKVASQLDASSTQITSLSSCLYYVYVYMCLCVQGSAVAVSVQGDGGHRYNDGQWHSIIATRRGAVGTIIVNSQYRGNSS